MKQLSILSGILILLTAICISAQSTNKSVESINKRYAEIAEKARLCDTDDDQGEYGEMFMNTLTINSRRHQWRVLGIYGQTFKFFYRAVDNDEKRLYPDQLVFVKVERKESSRNYVEEFLYSDAGVLMLYIQKAENDDQAPAERSIYFSGAKAIRVIEVSQSRDRLTAKDSATGKAVNEASLKIAGLFSRSIKI